MVSIKLNEINEAKSIKTATVRFYDKNK